MPVAYGLIEPIDLSLERLDHRFEGLRIIHISDLHVHRPRRWHQAMIEQLARTRADLALFTGDYAHWSEDAERYQTRCDLALDLLQRLSGRMNPRLGCFGVFGNHDGNDFQQRADDLPIRWLRDEAVELEAKGLRLLGLGSQLREYAYSDPLPLVRSLGRLQAAQEPDHTPAENVAAVEPPAAGLTLMLCHMPTALPLASDLGVDVLFAGHSHGGQVRLPNRRPLINRMDLPLAATTGILRHRHTLAGVSRGLGNGPLMPRLFCKPHVPIYTLHRNSVPGRSTSQVDCLQRW